MQFHGNLTENKSGIPQLGLLPIKKSPYNIYLKNYILSGKWHSNDTSISQILKFSFTNENICIQFLKIILPNIIARL
jgi:hypothetical protein